MKKGKRMKHLFTLIVCVVLITRGSFAQNGKLDSLFNARDTTAVLDSLMKDFDKFLDSLAAPKSFFAINIAVGTGFFSFEDKNSVFFSNRQKLIISPSIGYYHKSGLGLSASAFVMNDEGGLNFYQYAFSPSYDLIRRKFSTGISYTRYLTKDSLPFYSTPIKNELFTYFSYKGWWVRPSLNVSYGWGSKADYEKRKAKRLGSLLSRSNRYYVIVRNVESVQDLSMTVSLRKDFDWYNVLGKQDNITVTPVIMLNGGTQTYGFNTSYSYNAANGAKGLNLIRANSLPSNQEISDNSQFALQSASMVLRAGYLKGRLLIQPQVLFDYYLLDMQDGDSRLNTVFSLSAGISF
jgi:hypothetical protein